MASGGAPPTVRRIQARQDQDLHRGRAPATTATTAGRRRTTCSCTSTSWPRRVKAKDTVPADYLPFGLARSDLPQGPAGHGPGRDVLRRAHHQLDLHRRQVHQPEQLRRRRRPVPARQRAGAAGARSATPATWTRPATRCRRRDFTGTGPGACSSTAAGWCAAPGRSRWTRRSSCSTNGRRRCRCRPATPGSSWCPPTAATSRHEVAGAPQPSGLVRVLDGCVASRRPGPRRRRRRSGSGAPDSAIAAARPGCSRSRPPPRRRPARCPRRGHRGAGGGHRAEEHPAERLAPCSARGRRLASTEETISWTMPKVVRSSCSR